MHHLGLIRPFRAFHFLVGGDWGAENQLHSHDYRVEWTLGGPHLDRHGYLLDLVAVEAILEAALSEVKDRTLNDLPAFQGLNPSVERLARWLSVRLIDGRTGWDPEGRLTSSVVKVWEHEAAWASWTTDLPPVGQ